MAPMNATSDESRGQLILVGGITLGVLLITVGIVFNAALFTEAQSVGNTYNGDAAVSESLKDSFRIDIQQTITTENAQMDGEAVEDTEQVVENINTYSQNRQARYGVITSLNHVSTASGTRVEWSDSSRNFTNSDGNVTWEVVSGINNIRKYRFTPRTSTLTELADPSATTLGDSAFGMTFNPDSPDNKTRYFYRDSSTDQVKIRGVDSSDSITMTCSIRNSSSLNIHLTTNSLVTPVESNQCRQLWPPMDVEAIEFINGDKAYGRFNFIADGSIIVPDPDNMETAGAVYAMKIDYLYQQSNVKHTTTTRLALGEP